MTVLVVDAFHGQHIGKQLVDRGIALLEERGRDVERLDLLASGFPRFMTEEERRRYHDDDNVCCPHVAASVALVRSAEAVLFAYPTTMFTIPAHLKGWLERTMLPGVGFLLNDKHQVRPGLPAVRRVGVITTTPHDRATMRSVGDNGRRTLLRSFRANCASRCRRSYVSIHESSVATDPDGAAQRVERTLSRW